MYPQKQLTNMSKIITSVTNDAQGRNYQGSQNTSNCLQEPVVYPFTTEVSKPLNYHSIHECLHNWYRNYKHMHLTQLNTLNSQSKTYGYCYN
jgi:hypothetical protein